MADLVAWAAVPLRIIIGAIFIVHGFPKLREFEGTVKFMKKINFRPPAFWAVLLGSAELFGGIGVLLGFLTRLFAFILIVSMLVSLYFNKVVWKKPFSGGYEFDLLILAALVALFLLGSGNLSVDMFLGLV